MRLFVAAIWGVAVSSWRPDLTASGLRTDLTESSVLELNDTVDPVFGEYYATRCHAVTECYCIRHTIEDKMNDRCGWCSLLDTNGSKGHAKVGTPAGPDEEEGPCSHWIWKNEECTYLYCADDYNWQWALEMFGTSIVLGLVVLCAIPFQYASTDNAATVALDEQLVNVKRTSAEFRKGLWGKRALMSSTPYQVAWESTALIKEKVYVGVMNSSALHGTLFSVLKFGLCVSICYTSIRLLPMVVSHQWFGTIGQVLSQSQGLAGTAKMVVGFLFSFYTLGRVSWWWEIMDCGRIMQGRTHDIAVLVGSAVSAEEHGDPDVWWEKKWQIYRYLMLFFILTFRPLCPSFQPLDFEKLTELGFLEEQEAKLLSKSLHPRKVILKWLMLWVTGNVQDKHVKQLILEKCTGLRGAAGTLHDTIEKRAPWSFEALLYSMVYLWILVMPFDHTTGTHDRKVIQSTPIVFPVLNCMIVALFYVSMLNLLEAFKDPFGVHTDSLHVQNILLETETTVVDFLTSPVPKSLQSICKEELYDGTT